MEVLTLLIRILFGFFIAYTLFYILQWMTGLVISVYRLCRFEDNRATVRRLFTDDIVGSIPVSVIIPAYNEEACICDTVDALLQEDYPALEIIVVDDGSTDGSARCILDRYALVPDVFPHRCDALHTAPVRSCYSRSFSGKRIRLICKEGGGKGDALNCGFNLSSAPYCVVVDADTQVRPGSLRMMVSRFLTDPGTVVCAGCVGTLLHSTDLYRSLPPMQKLLVLFQRVEYYRTFYIHRLMFDQLNANVIVSGAFAMFDRALVIQAGGYHTDTVGEDMELTIRLHAFCRSQHRPYRIAYVPEARCDTQVPFRYRDYFHQRRRWHIGLMQSLARHFYMIGERYYGWVGVLSILFTLIYELCSPFIELAGLLLLIPAGRLHLLNWSSAVSILAIYLLIALLSQSLLLRTIRRCHVEPMSGRRHLLLLLVASTEFFLFHPINMVIKLITFCTYGRYRRTWSHIHRHREAPEES